MIISPYQVNNVLRVYGDQLLHNRIPDKSTDENIPQSDKISISAEAKRKAVIEKISSNIIDKITQYGPNDNIEEEVFKKLENEYGANLAVTEKSPVDLIFKVIDENGETINSLSVEDSKFLKHKLEEITKETVNNNMM